MNLHKATLCRHLPKRENRFIQLVKMNSDREIQIKGAPQLDYFRLQAQFLRAAATIDRKMSREILRESQFLDPPLFDFLLPQISSLPRRTPQSARTQAAFSSGPGQTYPIFPAFDPSLVSSRGNFCVQLSEYPKFQQGIDSTFPAKYSMQFREFSTVSIFHVSIPPVILFNCNVLRFLQIVGKNFPKNFSKELQNLIDNFSRIVNLLERLTRLQTVN